jgi:hypothetical protein
VKAGFAAVAVRKFRTTPAVMRLLLPLGRAIAPRRWIFVVGCYNSGTSLLAAVLGSHPAIAALPQEGAFLTDSLPPPERFGWTRMWCRCEDAMRLDAGPAGDERARRIKRQWSLWLPRSPENVLEKSVANVVHIPFLEAHFRPASFVYIVRDGYAVAEGLRRKARPGRWGRRDLARGYAIADCAQQWARSDELARANLAGVERSYSFTYESFTADPARVSADVLAFLGLPPLGSRLFERAWSIHDLDEPIRNMNPDSHSRLSAEDVAEVRRVAGPVLDLYGYAPPAIAR